MEVMAHRIAINPKLLKPTMMRELDRTAGVAEKDRLFTPNIRCKSISPSSRATPDSGSNSSYERVRARHSRIKKETKKIRRGRRRKRNVPENID